VLGEGSCSVFQPKRLFFLPILAKSGFFEQKARCFSEKFALEQNFWDKNNMNLREKGI
jgi:hypothetical protein